MTDENRTRKDFFERAGAKLLERDRAFAAKHGYTVTESQGLWRVYYHGYQCAMANIESDAMACAYALAMVGAGARLPDRDPDPIGQALNEGNGTYRP